jgi:hypothetical protein
MITKSTDDQAGVFKLAVHEYTHAVQTTFGGPMAAWLMEGGAVFMQCLSHSRLPTAFGTNGTFSYCMENMV